MQTNRVSPVSYRAQIPKVLKDELFSIANNRGHSTCSAYLEQAKNIQQWGHDSSSLAVFEERTRDGVKRTFGFVNNYMKPLRRVLLPFKDNIFDSFMALKEKDILDAENKLGF